MLRGSRSGLTGAAAVLLTALAVSHGTGLSPRWWAAWLAALPALAFALRASRRAAFAVAFLGWAGGSLNMWHYLRTTLGVPLPIVVAAVTLPAAVFAAAVLLARALAARGHPLLAMLALPSTWTAYEHLAARVSPHGTFGSLAYTQADFLPIWQAAAVCGGVGVSFLVLLPAAAAAVATGPDGPHGRRRVVLASAGLLVLALGYGAWRLRDADASRPPLAVAVAATDTPEQPTSFSSAAGRELLARYTRVVESASAAGASVVVLPETTLRVSGEEAGSVAGVLAGATGGRPTLVVVGLDHQTGPVEENVAVAVAADGSAPAVYAKRHLLLPPEARYRPGTGLTVVRLAASVQAGLAVCKDLDFPRLGRDYSRAGARLLLVPAWDFGEDGWLHARMAALRGVESGFAMARAARSGRLTLSDDRGRVVAEGISQAATVALVKGHLPAGRGTTPYARLGDWCGWLACGLLALALVVATARR